MTRITLGSVALMLLLVAIGAFLIAGIIGASAGIFGAIASGGIAFPAPEHEHGPGTPINEHKVVAMAKTNQITIATAIEGIVVRESPDNNIRAWFHGDVSTAPDRLPHLVVVQKGGTVEIQVKRKQDSHYDWISETNTQLEVAIPAAYRGKLAVNSTSGNITLEDQAYTALALSTTSGNIEANGLGVNTFSLSTNSGNIHADNLDTDQTKIDTTSGDVEVVDLRGNLEAHSTSGNLEVGFAKTPAHIIAESNSGEVTMRLPEDANFTLHADSTSGDLTCAFPVTTTIRRSGGRDDEDEHHLSGTVGTGKNNVKVCTTSGDVQVTQSSATP